MDSEMQNEMALDAKKWRLIEKNKWVRKFSPTNYFFFAITPFADGSYELKCLDAELTDYSETEKALVRAKYKIRPYSDRQLALKLMEHNGHYEWVQLLSDKVALIEYLDGWTSFPLSKLKNLKEYEAAVN